MYVSRVRVKLNLYNFITKNHRFLSTKPNLNNEEYTAQPEYPPIADLSYNCKQIRKRALWHDKIKSLNTIEEKLLEINMPKYYGYKSVILDDNKIPYNSMPLSQHCTRTRFNEVLTLPGFYQGNHEKVETFYKNIKSEIEDALLFEYSGYNRHRDDTISSDPTEKEKIISDAVIFQINRVILNSLSADLAHLQKVEIDLNPRHEAFWFASGSPTELVRRIRKGVKWQEGFADEPVDRAIQYLGTPYLAVRHQLPLQPIEETQTTDKSLIGEIPIFKYDPRSLGYSTDFRHGTTIPGFWPGSPHEFGLLSYQNRSFIQKRNPNFGIEDNQEALHCLGIQSSFAWLFGQACYQGFSTFNDLTYPLTTQTIVTNGKLFSFYVYQMNTTLVHQDAIDNNEKSNVCWGTKEMELFQEIDENGKLIGFNDDVLKNLIHFYVNEPKQRTCEMKPYLGENEKCIADIENEERRVFLERTYKHMVSNRPRHRLVDEVYNWEKIYKIDNKTRMLEPKRRPFELKINPFKRRMDEHTPIYIPKAIRPEGPKSKKKWEKMYYP